MFRSSEERKVGIDIIGPTLELHITAPPNTRIRHGAFRIREHITVILTANCPGLSITPGNNLGYITLGTQTCLNIIALPYPCLKAEMVTKVPCCLILGPSFRHK